MRRKLEENIKRGTIIGVKTDKTTKKQIEYIAEREAQATSTYIHELIKNI